MLVARERLQVSKRKAPGEFLALLHDWAKAHTYDVLSEDTNFDEHTIFVAAHEIVPDIRPFPKTARERKYFQPKHTVRIVLTSIAMSYMLPVLSLHPDVFPIVTWMADATHKMSVTREIKVILVCINDATLSGKVVGILLTMNEKKFDFFLAARTITNVVESIAKLEKERLPGKRVILASLPSPLPSFN